MVLEEFQSSIDVIIIEKLFLFTRWDTPWVSTIKCLKTTKVYFPVLFVLEDCLPY